MYLEIVALHEFGFCCALDRDSIHSLTAREESLG
jgi:hypothetical protein